MKNRFKNILIVEDEFLALEYLKDILKRLDIKNVFDAKSADRAIEVVKNEEIDMIFMDINIRGKTDGICCAKEINKEQNIPIIYTTAYIDDQTIEEAGTTNIYGYIIKPFNLKDVQGILLTANNFVKTQEQQLKHHNEDLEKKLSKKTIILKNEYVYYSDTKTMKHQNKTIVLTKREIQIIDLLCFHLNQTVSYELLKSTIWSDKDIASSTIRDAISRLKKKLPDIYIETITNVGYQLNN